MDMQFKIGVGIGVVFGLLPFAVKDMPHWITYSGIGLGIAFALWGILPNHDRLPTILVVLFMMSTVGLFTSAGWYLNLPAERSPKSFSWAWEPVSDEQGRRIADALKDKKIALIRLAYTANAGAELAASFKKALEGVDLRTAPVDDARTNILFPGLTGIGVYAHDDLAQLLKNAISSATNLPVAIIEPANRAAAPDPTIVIGAKPAPDPLPPEIHKELSELAESMNVLSRSLSDFSADRQREKGRIPPPQGAREAWEASVAFSNETETLLERKFGEQITTRIAQLSKMGIVMAWSVQTSRDPAKIAKWFAVVSEFLQKDNLEEARTTASNEDFWFPR